MTDARFETILKVFKALSEKVKLNVVGDQGHQLTINETIGGFFFEQDWENRFFPLPSRLPLNLQFLSCGEKTV